MLVTLETEEVIPPQHTAAGASAEGGTIRKVLTLPSPCVNPEPNPVLSLSPPPTTPGARRGRGGDGGFGGVALSLLRATGRRGVVRHAANGAELDAALRVCRATLRLNRCVYLGSSPRCSTSASPLNVSHSKTRPSPSQVVQPLTSLLHMGATEVTAGTAAQRMHWVMPLVVRPPHEAWCRAPELAQ